MSWAKLGKLPRQEICEAADWELLTFKNTDFIYQDPGPQPCCPHLNKLAPEQTAEFFRAFCRGCEAHSSCFSEDGGKISSFGLVFRDVGGVAVQLHKGKARLRKQPQVAPEEV